MPVFNQGDTFQPDSIDVRHLFYFGFVDFFKKKQKTKAKRRKNRSAQALDRS